MTYKDLRDMVPSYIQGESQVDFFDRVSDFLDLLISRVEQSLLSLGRSNFDPMELDKMRAFPEGLSFTAYEDEPALILSGECGESSVTVSLDCRDGAACLDVDGYQDAEVRLTVPGEVSVNCSGFYVNGRRLG